MLELTAAAAVEVHKIRRLDGEDVLRVWRPRSDRRVGVRIGFVRAPRDDDEVGISNGIPISIDRDLAAPLSDMVLDVRESRTDVGLYIRRR